PRRCGGTVVGNERGVGDVGATHRSGRRGAGQADREVWGPGDDDLAVAAVDRPPVHTGGERGVRGGGGDEAATAAGASTGTAAAAGTALGIAVATIATVAATAAGDEDEVGKGTRVAGTPGRVQANVGGSATAGSVATVEGVGTTRPSAGITGVADDAAVGAAE